MKNSSSGNADTPKRAAWRDVMYTVIFEADTRAGQLFDIVLLIAILGSIFVVSAETVASVQANPAWMTWLVRAEWLLTILFTLEYVARLICVRQPLRYMFSFFGIIDFLACTPLYFALLTDLPYSSMAIVRSVRLLRVFRVFKMIRMIREAHSLKQAIYRARDKIYVFLAVVLVAVTISGTLMYQIEMGAENNQFTSIPQSMYWAIVTMTTVGYGDVVPHTTAGKFLSAILILLGYSLIIVPTGFVSAEIQAQRQQVDTNSRVCPDCFREGHSADANYCDRCGSLLIKSSHTDEPDIANDLPTDRDIN